MDKFTRFFLSIIFVSFFILGFSLYKGYGIPWDEPIQQRYGQNVIDYALGVNTKLLKNNDRYYGPVIEVLMEGSARLFHITDPLQVIYFRHLINFSIYFVGIVFFFLLVFKVLGDWKLALFGCCMLVVSPRIFADAFYNSKDIPLMVGFIISAYTAFLFFSKPSFKISILHAFVSALTTDIRIVGLLVVLLTVLVFLYRYRIKGLKYLASYLVLTFIFVVAFWPTLWASPVKSLYIAFVQMSRYNQNNGGLFYGRMVFSKNVPWFYIPGWIAVTTPFTYLGAFFAGLVSVVKNIKKISPEVLYVFGWLFGSLGSVIVFHSVLYNAWRQMFFIYPALVFIALYGLVLLKQHKRIFMGAILLIGIEMLFTVYTMVVTHPFQNVYFNHKTDKFDLDYWGLSYRKSLEHLMMVSLNRPVILAVDNMPGHTNQLFLSNSDRSKITTVSLDQTFDYFVTNRPGLYSEKPLYCVSVLENNLSCVYEWPVAKPR